MGYSSIEDLQSICIQQGVNNIITKIKGAIFDLDGTLVDSMGIWQKIDEEFLVKRGIQVPVNLADMIRALTFEDCARYFREEFGLSESIYEIMEEWNAMALYEYTHNVELKPGARDYLEYLKDNGIKIGLATTNTQPLLQIALKNNGIFHYFDSISTVAEVSRNKNFPDIFLLAAQKMGLEPSQCVVFEDILPAIYSAKKAGMKVVGVYDRYSEYEIRKIKENADLFIWDFTELMEYGTTCYGIG